MKRWFKVSVCAFVLGCFLNGCFGSFGATRWLWSINKNAHPNVFVQTLIMWCLTVLPAYEIFMFGDWLIINIVEYFMGSNPIADNLDLVPGEDGTLVARTQDGQQLKFSAVTDNRMLVEQEGVILGEINIDKDKKVKMTNYATADVKTLDPENIPAL